MKLQSDDSVSRPCFNISGFQDLFSITVPSIGLTNLVQEKKKVDPFFSVSTFFWSQKYRDL